MDDEDVGLGEDVGGEDSGAPGAQSLVLAAFAHYPIFAAAFAKSSSPG